MLPSSTSITNSSLLSSSSSSSPSSSSNNKNIKTQKSMEDLWKDITINSLPTTPIHHIHNIHHPTPNSHFRGMILQDFLNNSNNNEEDRRNSSTIRSSTNEFESSPAIIPPHIKPPTTEFQFFENEMMNTESQLQGNSSVPNLIAGDAAFDALASSSLLSSFAAHNYKKRLSENQSHLNASDSVDRRHKRMIKNRESAARSRARKQRARHDVKEIRQYSKILTN
ncbi:Protein FD [Bienertia sinuspersici]